MIATGMIIVCHICQKNNMELMYWFNVGVQIFLFMSGWLYGKKRIDNPVDFIVKNSIKILKYYWLYLLIMIPVYFFFARDVISVGMVVNALVGAGTITGMGHLWFVPYIICCYVLTPLLYFLAKKLSEKNRMMYCLGVLSMCGLIFLYSYFYQSYFNSAWLICYVLGYFMAKAKQVYSIDEGTYLWSITPIFLLSNSIKIYAEYVRAFSGIIERIYGILLPYCHVALGVFLFFALLQIGRKIGIGKNVLGKKVLEFSDKYSYQIYICHGFFVLSSFSILEKEVLPFGIEVLIALMITILAAIALKWCGTKIEYRI